LNLIKFITDSTPRIQQGPPKIIDSGAVIACVAVGVCLFLILAGGLFYRYCVYNLEAGKDVPLVGSAICNIRDGVKIQKYDETRIVKCENVSRYENISMCTTHSTTQLAA
jgi:hypothetical protein